MRRRICARTKPPGLRGLWIHLRPDLYPPKDHDPVQPVSMDHESHSNQGIDHDHEQAVRMDHEKWDSMEAEHRRIIAGLLLWPTMPARP